MRPGGGLAGRGVPFLSYGGGGGGGGGWLILFVVCHKVLANLGKWGRAQGLSSLTPAVYRLRLLHKPLTQVSNMRSTAAPFAAIIHNPDAPLYR